jgi:hypothetical protein
MRIIVDFLDFPYHFLMLLAGWPASCCRISISATAGQSTFLLRCNNNGVMPCRVLVVLLLTSFVVASALAQPDGTTAST